MVQSDGQEDHLHAQAGLQRLHKSLLRSYRKALLLLRAPLFPSTGLPLLPGWPHQLSKDPHPQDSSEGHLKSPVVKGKRLPQDDHSRRRGQSGDHVVSPACHVRPHPQEEHDKRAENRNACADHEDIQEQEADAQKTARQIGACAPPQELVGADADKRQVEPPIWKGCGQCH